VYLSKCEGEGGSDHASVKLGKKDNTTGNFHSHAHSALLSLALRPWTVERSQ